MNFLKLISIFTIMGILQANASEVPASLNCQTLVRGSEIAIRLEILSPASARLVAQGMLTTTFELEVTHSQLADDLLEQEFNTTARGFNQAGDQELPLTGELIVDLSAGTGEINLEGTLDTRFPTLFPHYELRDCSQSF